ncbi:hypothetical protein GSI_14786 [Ganoderma sinense ZZ0214-1]|uniref:Uncharacterized protein n=1 Tax=Ganoderma sinense ZZ0214-1 TaxID=1077348 RepID=A0A2G8RPM7_9APHY|nr:hypothetical protein GSI_14786 [Ganoderma sinense ZZ0214-1]
MGSYPEQSISDCIAASHDKKISPEQAADERAKQCKKSANSDSVPKPERDISDSDCHRRRCQFDQVRRFLWRFWTEAFELAQDYASMHDRITYVFVALKAKGVHARRLNTLAFLACRWALDVQDEAFFGVACMRMDLEPLSLSSTREPTASQGSVFEEQEQELAASWLRIAGAKMHGCREILGPKGNLEREKNRDHVWGDGWTWDGVDRYHPGARA